MCDHRPQATIHPHTGIRYQWLYPYRCASSGCQWRIEEHYFLQNIVRSFWWNAFLEMKCKNPGAASITAAEKYCTRVLLSTDHYARFNKNPSLPPRKGLIESRLMSRRSDNLKIVKETSQKIPITCKVSVRYCRYWQVSGQQMHDIN